MLHFDSDYMEGAHPEILARLCAMNLEKTSGYGADMICAQAKEKILKACACPDGEVHFLVGGTQTNATVIDALLRPYQCVLAADSGHINVHEAGAVEATGHKVVGLPHRAGLVDAAGLRAYLEAFYADTAYMHMPIPGMLYISHPSEFGTLYTRAGLEALAQVCHEYGLYLYLDGARLGYGLASAASDLCLEDIARLCDAFYIGGTKVGALFGEAVVFPRAGLCPHFFTTVKRHGALLAKGWLLGLQFDTLFTDGLYLRIAENALVQAARLRALFLTRGYRLYADSPTNQQFFVLPEAKMKALAQKVGFESWAPLGNGETAVRFVTSWATTDAQIDALARILE